MTPMESWDADVAAITRLRYRYSELADGGWDKATHDSPAMGELFVDDCHWSVRGHDGRTVFDVHGRDDLVAALARFEKVPVAMHYVTNPEIEIDGAYASGRWHMFAYLSGAEQGRGHFILGLYDETYVKTASDGWRIKTSHSTIRARIRAGSESGRLLNGD